MARDMEESLGARNYARKRVPMKKGTPSVNSQRFQCRKSRQWPSGRADFSEPGGPGFDSSSRQPQVVAHQH